MLIGIEMRSLLILVYNTILQELRYHHSHGYLFQLKAVKINFLQIYSLAVIEIFDKT